MRLSVILLLSPLFCFPQIESLSYESKDLFNFGPPILQSIQVPTASSPYEKQILTGLKLWRDGKLDSAANHYISTLELYPELAYPNYLTAYVKFQQTDLSSASHYFAETLHRDPLLFDAKFMLGIVDILKLEYDKAEKTMRDLCEIPNASPAGYFGLGLIELLKKVNFSKATKFFEQAIQIDSSYVRPYLPLSMLYHFQGNQDAALACLNKAVSLNPRWEKALLTRAILLKELDLTKYESDLNLLVLLYPANAEYHRMKGFLSIQRRNYSEAVENFRNSLIARYATGTVEPNDLDLLYLINYYYSRASELSLQARKDLDRGISLIFDRYNQAASEHFERTLRGNRHVVCKYWRAYAFSNIYKHREAIPLYQSVLKADSTELGVHLNIGRSQLFLKNFDSALDAFNYYIKKDPENHLGYMTRGLAYSYMNDYQSACADFQTVMELNPKVGTLYYEDALCSHSFASYKLTYFDRKMIKSGDSSLTSAYYRYMYHLDKLDTTAALISLDSASAEKKNRLKEKIHLALLKLAQEKDNQELQLNAYNRLVENFSAKTQYLLQRGELLQEMGKPTEARDDYRKYIEIFPSKPVGYLRLGEILLVLGQIKEGEKNIKKGRRLEKD